MRQRWRLDALANAIRLDYYLQLKRYHDLRATNLIQAPASEL